MPPTPKPAALRQRRNRTTTAATLPAGPVTRIELPERAPSWHALTLRWWEVIWASPMVGEWVDADVPGLVALAYLWDAFYQTGEPKVHAEARMASREFGLSPLSRRQLQWEIKRLAAPPVKPVSATPPRKSDPRLRLVSA